MIFIRPVFAPCLLCALSAVALHSVRATAQAPQNSAPLSDHGSPADKLTADEIAEGKQLFAAECASCHGVDGSGQLGPNLHGITQRLGDQGVFAIIRNGTGGMPPVMALNDHRAWEVIGYVRTLGGAGAMEAANGDPAKGQAVYDANGCSACHAINGVGGGVGPQLTAIGRSRAPRYLHDFLLDPGKNPPADLSLPERGSNAGYLMVHVVTNDGEQVTGIRVNEDTFTIDLRDVSGRFYSFDKSKLKTIEREPGKTVMPSYSHLSASDLDNLVAYLSGLKGTP